MKTKKILSLTLMLFFTVSVSNVFAASETASIIQSEQPAVEVMFVLDTTGSMGGLIAAAKEKIWSIANTLSSADPAPEIKMGLVGYRDRGDQYVTVFTPLSDDLDTVYSNLMKFKAGGGGDGPESVNQALHEAVIRTVWSRNASVYRVIFLVGDARPHMDYDNDIKYRETCRKAADKNIIINTIQCGNMQATRPVWQEIAKIAFGEYFQVAQAGSAVLYDTPYDKEIAQLSRKLDNTRIFYGSADYMREMESRKDKADEIYEAAAPSAVAKRAIFNSKASGEKNFLGKKELVLDVETKGVSLDEIKKEELPGALQGMDSDEIKNHIKEQSLRRKTLQAEIDGLAKKRQAHIENLVKNEAGKGVESLDTKIYNCIKTQAADKKIVYTDGPAY